LAANIADLSAQASSLARMTVFGWSTFSFAGSGQPAERIPGLAVDAA